MLRLYDNIDSGNGYKVRLLLTQLGLSFERVEIDSVHGETRRVEFLTINPAGQIPTLRLEDGDHLAESNAILCYLAEETDFWPDDRKLRAETLRWLFFEQYSHEPYIAVLRAWNHLPEMTELQEAQVPERRQRGYKALDVMEQHLTNRDYFVGQCYGLADIALYAYTHVASDGSFDLTDHPAIRAWLKRVAGQANHIPIGAMVGVDPDSATQDFAAERRLSHV